MKTKIFSLCAICLALGACSTPPKPPTVDDSNKRPVNVSEAVGLQMCRSELTAAKVVLTETASSRWSQTPTGPTAPRSASGSLPLAAPTSEAAAAPNHVYIVRFETGSSEFKLPADTEAKLIEQARSARFISIRGRTDAGTDSAEETRLAQRRSEAAYNFLMHAVKLPADGVRVSWQGAGDQAEPGAAAIQRQANRRVEIEIYDTKPVVEVIVG